MRAHVLVALAVAGCGKIYLEPVTLDAKTDAPAVMMLFDKSGSMSVPLMPTGSCAACVFPTCNEATCPTRMGVARQWSADLFGALGNDARWGLTIFPADNVCGPAGSNQVLTPISEAPGAGAIVAQLQSQAVGGGTPTSASLAFAGQAFPTGTAERIIVLFTDGLPNCNPQNPNTCVAPAACRCTLNGGNCGTVVNDSDPNNFCRRGCLDEDATLSAVRSLTTFGVTTLVIGFGNDFTDPSVIDATAQAGIEGVRCGADSDCFGYTCTAGRCTGGALRASDLAGLTAVTPRLRERFTLSSRCRWTILAALATGPDAVELAGKVVPVTDFVLETPTRVRFLGATCQRLIDDGALAPKFSGKPAG